MSKAETLKVILKDEDRKPLPKIVKEAVHFGIIEQEIPYYYFENLLYKKEIKNYQDYIGQTKRGRIIDDFYFKNGENENLENKLLFGKILERNGVKTPKILAHNAHLELKSDKESVQLTTPDDLARELHQLIELSENNSIFIKRILGLGGLHVFKFDQSNINDSDKINELFELMKEMNFIFQETTQQHEKLNRIYSGSINTVRVNTYRVDNDVKMVSGLMRFGTNGSVVDNGNFFVPLDVTHWVLHSSGKSFLKYGGENYTKHPNTDFVFKDFNIPFADAVVREISKAAMLFEDDFIGWDVAITPNGPEIIEGNQNPHVIMTQITSGGFKTHPYYSKIFKKVI